jgi:hypothetical protein
MIPPGNNIIELPQRPKEIAAESDESVAAVKVAPTAPRGAARIVIIWVTGFFLSCLLVWVISAIWLSPYPPYVWEPTINRYVVAPGTHRSWAEGNGTTRIGRYGVPAIPDVTQLKTETALIWGDSHVEAIQVDDAEKMPQVVTRVWTSRHADRPLTAVGIGMRGWGLADIYFQMPYFERLVPQVRANFLVIGEIEDLNPDGDNRESRFLSDPTTPSGFKFVESHWVPRGERLKQFLMRWHLQVVWDMFKRCSEVKIRFAPGRAATPGKVVPKKPDPIPVDGWRFALQRLQDQAKAPLVLIYIPRLPAPLTEGRLSVEDPSADKAKALHQLCLEMNIPLIDLTEEFIAMARSGRGFPRGFPNTVPWSGHLNAEGHRCVAQAICRYLEDHPR